VIKLNLQDTKELYGLVVAHPGITVTILYALFMVFFIFTPYVRAQSSEKGRQSVAPETVLQNPSPTMSNTNVTASGNGIAVNTDGGDANIQVTNNIYKVSDEEADRLSDELAITKSAVRNLFKILELNEVAPDDLDSELRKIAYSYKELEKRLANYEDSDPAVVSLRKQAQEALNEGDFEAVERLLNEASTIDLEAVEALELAARQRRISASKSMSDIGYLKLSQMNYGEASKYFREAKDLLPEGEELKKAEYLNSEARALRAEGNYESAEEALKKALTIRKSVLGEDRPDVAQSLNNLAVVYSDQGKYDEAVPLLKQAISILEKVHGNHHISVAKSLSSLALIYINQGKYDHALPLLEKAAAIFEKKLGLEPYVPKNLKMAFEWEDEQGQAYKDKLQRKHLMELEKRAGINILELANSIHSLAFVYHQQGQYVNAEYYYQIALTIREEKLGLDNAIVAQSIQSLAELYHLQLLNMPHIPTQAISAMEQIIGPQLAQQLSMQSAIALVSHFEKAKALYEMALTIFEKTFGSDHPATIRIQKGYDELISQFTPDKDDH